ncbi:hypothetical protein XH98_17170 [Bradyrhizobium sp. CCBAU 51745]|nr:hypothetical protein [Bradyrhizobium sp. CCBAU 51745]
MVTTVSSSQGAIEHLSNHEQDSSRSMTMQKSILVERVVWSKLDGLFAARLKKALSDLLSLLRHHVCRDLFAIDLPSRRVVDWSMSAAMSLGS